MQISETIRNSFISSVYGIEQYGISRNSGQILPSSGDTVSISAEARSLAAQLYVEQSIAKAQEKTQEGRREESLFQYSNTNDTSFGKGISGGIISENSDDSDELKRIFSEYMYTTEGRKSAGQSSDADDSIDKKIENLEKKIDLLVGQLEKLSTPETTDASKSSSRPDTIDMSDISGMHMPSVQGGSDKNGQAKGIYKQIEELDKQIAALKKDSLRQNPLSVKG